MVRLSFRVLDTGIYFSTLVMAKKCVTIKDEEFFMSAIKTVLSLLFFSLSVALFAQHRQAIHVDEIEFALVEIPEKNFAIAETEVTQDLYELIMGENPSHNVGEKFPVENVSWYDAIVFCNLLSQATGRQSVYSVDGSANTEDWDYPIHSGAGILSEVEIDMSADGFRLPNEDEWIFAAKGGADFLYSGSNDANEVAWFSRTSGAFTHEVASKKPNGYGLYDMSGNVWEWCNDKIKGTRYRLKKGGSWCSGKELCTVSFRGAHYPSRNQPCYTYFNMGFRIAVSR